MAWDMEWDKFDGYDVVAIDEGRFLTVEYDGVGIKPSYMNESMLKADVKKKNSEAKVLVIQRING